MRICVTYSFSVESRAKIRGIIGGNDSTNRTIVNNFR